MRNTATHIMGRLKTAYSRNRLRGHDVRARSGSRVLDSSRTDGAGRFVLTWTGVIEGSAFIELSDAEGAVVESVELAAEDMVSPPVIVFSGMELSSSGGEAEAQDTAEYFEADGDHPLCVTSSCIDVELTWRVPPGALVSILSDGRVVRDELPANGSLKVAEKCSKKYVLRRSIAAPHTKSSDITIEVKRYPSLSLVMEGDRFRKGTDLRIGTSTSCPSDEGGLKATILTSDPIIIPRVELLIPAGSTWASTQVRLGEKTGEVRVTATAPGYVRDEVAFTVE